MTPELQEYYEKYFDLFLSKGWKQFIEDVSDAAGEMDIRYVENEAQLKYLQGQLKILDLIVNWEAAIRNGYDAASDDNDEE